LLVWGGAGSNKQKGTGCPELSTEGAAQPVVPQAPETGAAVTVPKSFFFRNCAAHLHLEAAESAGAAGTTGVSKRTKVVVGGKEETTSGKQGPTTLIKSAYY